MKSLIEDIVGRLSEATFFSELCFRGQEFAASKGDTKELADVLVWMETDGLIIQVKERNKAIPTDQGLFEKWFSKKVLDKGSSQIADTVFSPGSSIGFCGERSWPLLYTGRTRIGQHA